MNEKPFRDKEYVFVDNQEASRTLGPLIRSDKHWYDLGPGEVMTFLTHSRKESSHV
ncbi:MAG: hypothetical protein JW932_06175 [Deltaproteobacteria bacterium]|nr:hypothetical protein [Deltaproteobacteria bacterium]